MICVSGAPSYRWLSVLVWEMVWLTFSTDCCAIHLDKVSVSTAAMPYTAQFHYLDDRIMLLPAEVPWTSLSVVAESPVDAGVPQPAAVSLPPRLAKSWRDAPHSHRIDLFLQKNRWQLFSRAARAMLSLGIAFKQFIRLLHHMFYR